MARDLICHSITGSKWTQNEREKGKDVEICLWQQTVFVTGHVCMCPRQVERDWDEIEMEGLQKKSVRQVGCAYSQEKGKYQRNEKGQMQSRPHMDVSLKDTVSIQDPGKIWGYRESERMLAKTDYMRVERP